MSSKGKNKKLKELHPEEDPSLSIAVGKNVLRVGTRVEALDYLGNWYAAKIIKINIQKKEVQVHFDGWKSRWDVWLPYNSERIRFPKELKVKEKEWRVGERVIAKWGLDKKMYPATVARMLNENVVEVVFFDGVRKQFSKSTIKPDTEKLYRQFEDTRKLLMTAPKKVPLFPTAEEAQLVPVEPARPKRRLTEPASMADFVTDAQLKRRKRSSDVSVSEEDLVATSVVVSPSLAPADSSAATQVLMSSKRSKSAPKAGVEMSAPAETFPQTSLRRSRSGVSASPACAAKVDTSTVYSGVTGHLTKDAAEDKLHSSPAELRSPVSVDLPKLSIVLASAESSCVLDPPNNRFGPEGGSAETGVSFMTQNRVSPAKKTRVSSSENAMKIVKKVSASGSVEIVKKKNKSYMMFPIMTPADAVCDLRPVVDADCGSVLAAKTSIEDGSLKPAASRPKRGAPVEIAPENLKILATKSSLKDEKVCNPRGTSPEPKALKGKLKVRFPFSKKSASLEKADLPVPVAGEVDEPRQEADSVHAGRIVRLVRNSTESVPGIAERCLESSSREVLDSDSGSSAVSVKITSTPVEQRVPLSAESITMDVEANICGDAGNELSSSSKSGRSKGLASRRGSSDGSRDPVKVYEVKGFEKRFELFKMKWKEEKAKRRRMLDSPIDSEGDSASSSGLLIQNREVDSLAGPSGSGGETSEKTDFSFRAVASASGRPRRLPVPSAKLKSLREASCDAKLPSKRARVKTMPDVLMKKGSQRGRPRTRSLPVEIKEEPISDTDVVISRQGSHEAVPGSDSFDGKSPDMVAPTVSVSPNLESGVQHVGMELDESQRVPELHVVPVNDVISDGREASLLDATSAILPKKRVGWPRGRPRRKKTEQEVLSSLEARSLGPGRPKRDPLGADTSRTPHYGETMSFASMVQGERPSQRKRPAYSDKGFACDDSICNRPDEPDVPDIREKSVDVTLRTDSGGQKSVYPAGEKQCSTFVPPRSAALVSGHSVSQILASKIQRRVRQQRRQQSIPLPSHALVPTRLVPPAEQATSTPPAVPPTHSTSDEDTQDSIIVVQPEEISLAVSKPPRLRPERPAADASVSMENPSTVPTDSKGDELDLTNIKLKESQSGGKPVAFKRKKTLDFITGRLNQRRKTSAPPAGMGVRESPSPIHSKPLVVPSSAIPQGAPLYAPHMPDRTYAPDVYVSDMRSQHMMDPYIGAPPPHYRIHPRFSGATLSNNGTVRITYPGSHRHQIFPPGYIPIQSRLPGIPPGHHLAGGSMHMARPTRVDPFYPPFTGHGPSCGCLPCLQKRHGVLGECQVYPPAYGSFHASHAHAMSYQQHPPYHVHPPSIGQPHALLGPAVARPSFPDDPSAVQQQVHAKPALSEAYDRTVVKGAKRDAASKSGTPVDETVQAIEAGVGMGKGVEQAGVAEGGKLAHPVHARRRRARTEDSRHVLRSRQLSEKASLAPKEFTVETDLSEYRCPYRKCDKSFRKSALLDSHIQYFHAAKSVPKRARSSGSLSSSESNPASSLTSPVLVPTSDRAPAYARLPPSDLAQPQEKDSTEELPAATSGYASPTSDGESLMLTENSSDSESGSDVDLPSVDDCIKCVCEDEDETGFMIQCEQCVTWQHGECVGYADQKDVPSFYLCHVCSNPKGLRRAAKYDNDYTWFKQGKWPVSASGQKGSGGRQFFASAEQETFENIMMATHTLMAELHNVYHVLQGVKAKLLLLRNPDSSSLRPRMASDKIDRYSRGKSDTCIVSVGSSSDLVDDKSAALRSNVLSGVTPVSTLHGRIDVDVHRQDVVGEDSSQARLESELRKAASCGDQPIQTRDSFVSNPAVKVEGPVEGHVEELDVPARASGDCGLISLSDKAVLSGLPDGAGLAGKNHMSGEPALPGVADLAGSDSRLPLANAACVAAESKEPAPVSSVIELPGQDLAVFKRSSESTDTLAAGEVLAVENKSQSVNASSRDSEYEANTCASVTTDTMNAAPSVLYPQADKKDVRPVPRGCSDSSYAYRFSLHLDGIPDFVDDEKNPELGGEDSRSAHALLLDEVERLEEQVSDRLDDIEKQLTVLEEEYDGLAKSDEVIKRIQSQFQFPDLSTLLRTVERLKWIGIVNEKKQQQVRQKEVPPVQAQTAQAS